MLHTAADSRFGERVTHALCTYARDGQKSSWWQLGSCDGRLALRANSNSGMHEHQVSRESRTVQEQLQVSTTQKDVSDLLRLC